MSVTTSLVGQIPELVHLPGFYEPCSAISHLGGAVAFLFLGALLVRRGRGDRSRQLLLAIYAASCVLLLSLSGLYHMMVRGSAAREVAERLDHGAIFVLIAGTCTPAFGLLFRGRWRWGLLAGTWTAATAGIVLKTVFFSRVPEWLGLSLYLAMGWFGFLAAVRLGRRHGFAFIEPLLAGGLIYSTAAMLEFCGCGVLIPGVVHPHEIFHLSVLLAAFLHWQFTWQFATGEVRVAWALRRSPRAAPGPRGAFALTPSEAS
jgi:channel protein (hemolysin III family)